MALDERGRSRIPRRVAARLERRSQTAGGKTARVCFAADEILAGKFIDRLSGTRRLEKRVVLLGRSAGHRLEPVREMRRSVFERPVLHPLGNRIGDRRIERLTLAHRRNKFIGDGFGHVLANRLSVKDVRSVIFQTRIYHIISIESALVAKIS